MELEEGTQAPVQQFVQVPVPPHLVSEVYRLISERTLSSHETGIEDVPQDLEGEHDGQRIWPQSSLDQLASSDVKSMRRIAPVMDELAKQVPGWVTTSELVVATGLADTEISSAMTKLAGHVEKHYGADLHRPFWKRWHPDTGGRGEVKGQMQYRVDEEQAIRWQKARGSA